MKATRLLIVPAVALTIGTVAWTHNLEEFKLEGSDGAPGDRLGAAVALHGNTLIGGAPGQDSVALDAGAAYVFVYDGTTFSEQAKLVASDGTEADAFGGAVAINGDTAIVGAAFDDPNGTSSGSAYVFTRTGTTWSQQQKLVPNTGAAADQFGHSVAVSGDTALVGAIRADGIGSAYVFVRSGSTWTQQAQLTASDGNNFNGFGVSVSIEGDLALVGANHQNGVFADTGAAYVFSRTGTIWSEDQKLRASDGGEVDLFGQSVAISASGSANGDGVLIIGAPGDDDGGTNAGASYLFTNSGATWSQGTKRLGNPGDEMGGAVDASFGYTVTGATEYDYGGKSNCGGTILWKDDLLAGLAQLFVAEVQVNEASHGESVAIDDCWVVGGAPDNGEPGVARGSLLIFEVVSGRGVILKGNNVNPEVMLTSAGPNIGKVWTTQIDTTPLPEVDHTWHLVYAADLIIPKKTKWGEMIIDLSSPRIFSSLEATSGLAEHKYLVPNDMFLVGTKFSSQAALLSKNALPGLDTTKFAYNIVTLSNAERVIVGCYGQ